MENPATWTKAEYVVDKVMREWHDETEFVCGLSLVRQITDALREAGLLVEAKEYRCRFCNATYAHCGRNGMWRTCCPGCNDTDRRSHGR